MWIYGLRFYLWVLKNHFFLTSESLKIFWGPQKRPSFWILDRCVCLKKSRPWGDRFKIFVLYLMTLLHGPTDPVLSTLTYITNIIYLSQSNTKCWKEANTAILFIWYLSDILLFCHNIFCQLPNILKLFFQISQNGST